MNACRVHKIRISDLTELVFCSALFCLDKGRFVYEWQTGCIKLVDRTGKEVVPVNIY